VRNPLDSRHILRRGGQIPLGFHCDGRRRVSPDKFQCLAWGCGSSRADCRVFGGQGGSGGGVSIEVHLIDESVTFVVHQIVQRGAAQKWILTVRDGAPYSSAITGTIWKVGAVRRIDHNKLSLDETTTTAVGTERDRGVLMKSVMRRGEHKWRENAR